MIDLGVLTTEARNPNTMDLDQMTPQELVDVMNSEDGRVVAAVHEEREHIATAVAWAAEAISRGGRILYVGAGTSGRLGVLDAVECPPTFGVSQNLVVGLIAGGSDAFVHAKEGAEDSPVLGAEELDQIALCGKDLVVGLAASGRTPYVIGALRHARKIGARTVAIACNASSAIGREAELAIEPVTGPEVLTGSTRLKAGTAEKMILNMISTGAMVLNGKAYQNLMVDVKQSNEKLVARAQNITMEATGCSRQQAMEALEKADGSAKVAIVMLLTGANADQARGKLENAGGHVRMAVK
ncbi:N-acetylmuramic acid 6-phosphate etherase [Olsenella sp. AM04-33]|uniref:N-acetylmuramic acid 6-phosphate etherase n=1 Tax=Olsenella sp. AM04-33 TaxID=2292049 RepID=UPI000E52AFF9|nr:N-acetylmuramic acid 6-phosphate etherase [Olsenella sp. AM04-33]RHK01165.1 N-acetylmuramic acid 6-phosphate etherase [Olsenella sp. AM04-33]